MKIYRSPFLFLTLTTALTSLLPSQTQVYDLRAQRVSSRDSRIEPLKPVHVTTSTHNSSSVSLSGVQCAVYLSKDAKLDSGDRRLRTFTLQTLKPSQYGIQSLYVTPPLDLRAGTQYLLFYVDYNNRLRESKEGNNIVSVAVTGVAKPDLRMTGVKVLSSSPRAGELLSVQCAVRNQGGGMCRLASVGYYLSSNRSLSNHDFFLGERSFAFLAAGASRILSDSLQIPSHLKGTYYLIAKADYANKVAEPRETDNALLVSTSLRSADPSLRRLEFEPVLATAAHRIDRMELQGSVGGSGRLVVHAPSLAGRGYLLVLSQSPQLKIDAYTHFGLAFLNTSVFPNWLGTLDASGMARPALHVPRVQARLNAQVHCVFGFDLASQAERPVSLSIR